MSRNVQRGWSILLGVAVLPLLAFGGDAWLNPQPVPKPVPPPSAAQATQNPLAELTRSQDYSASRVSSYERRGGPRDNYWIPTTGEEVTLADIEGPGAITHSWMTHRGDGRDLVLRFYWDGSEHPSVEAPIGDFFGVAMGMNAVVDSYPIQVSSEGRARNCWWHMPFNRSARVTAAATRSANNRDRATVPLYFYIDYRVYAAPVPDIHYFHARFLETDPPVRGEPVTLLEAEGDGHFVGVVMGHRARMSGWFGEGDDIVTVDGTVSFLGTGTEDYFCDAWGFRVFSSLYHGAPALEGREPGDRLSAYRFHILDPIPFRKSFRLAIEHWPWISVVPNSGRGYYSSLGFWYQKSIHKAWPRLERIISLEPWDPDKGRWFVEGALEAEKLRVVDYRSTAGPPAVQRELPNLSGDHLLLFDAAGDGAFSVAVPAAEDGRYTLRVHLIRAPDYGMVSVSVNGESAGEPVDTFLKKDDLTRPIWPPKEYVFPGVVLRKGENTIGFSVKTKNPKSEGFKVGLDCLVLEKAAAIGTKGLILDLDADTGVTLEDGDRVSAWRNQVAASPARDFVKRDEGRREPGSGRPTLRKDVAALGGHRTIIFRRQELLNHDEDAFDHLITGNGYTWFAVVCAYEQIGKLKDVNSFFGNLRNGGNYEGIWGNLTDDNRVWIGSRNGITFGRWDENNPMVVAPEPLEPNRYYVVAGRMGAGTGTVPVELFINEPRPAAAKPIPVNPAANSSKLAVGQERDATNHPGVEAFDGELARFLIYERPLTDNELEETLKYLKNAYAIP